MKIAPKVKQNAESFLNWTADGVEARPWTVLSLLLALILVALLGSAASTRLWYDEIIIRDIALMPHWYDIWSFYYRGLDTIGPTSAFVVRMASDIPANSEIWARLPFIVSYLATLAGVFVFVRRRYTSLYAFIVVLLLTARPLSEYAVEGKSYALEFAAVAWAMVFWQSAVRGERRPWSVIGVWLMLSLAINSHQFAIFFLVPFALAQIVEDMRRRAIDWPMWLALILFPFTLLPTLHGQQLASKLYGAGFWARPELHLLYASYKAYFGLDWIFVLFLLIFGLSMTSLKTRGRWFSKETEVGTGFCKAEIVLIAVLASLPIYVLPASYLLHVYRQTYVMAFVIGLSVLLVTGVAESISRARLGGTVILIVFAFIALPTYLIEVPHGLWAVAHPSEVHDKLQREYEEQPWVKVLEASSLPVLAGDHSLYAPMHVYVSPELDKRLYFLTDIADVSKYPTSNTAQINFLSFGKELSYRTMDVHGFTAKHRHFLVVIGEDPAMWLPPYLLREVDEGRASMELVGSSYGNEAVYDVKLGPAAL